MSETESGGPAAIGGSAETGMRWLPLGFSRADFEADFRREYARRFLPQQRASLVVGFALYAGFGALDPYIIPEVKGVAWLIRYALVCPLLGAAFLLSYARRFETLAQPALACLGFAAGAGIIAMTRLASALGDQLYYAGLMLVSMYLYTFLRLRFPAATLASWGLVVCYELFVVRGGAVPVPVIVNNAFFLAAVNVIGMSACYSMERAVRVDFLQQRLIRSQADELRGALAEVKVLTGLLPICSWCKRVRDDGGYWSQIEEYLKAHSEATFSHGICPECLERVRAEAGVSR